VGVAVLEDQLSLSLSPSLSLSLPLSLFKRGIAATEPYKYYSREGESQRECGNCPVPDLFNLAFVDLTHIPLPQLGLPGKSMFYNIILKSYIYAVFSERV